MPYISNLSGAWILAEEATDSSYWIRHLQQSVYSEQRIDDIFSEETAILLEIGPGNMLNVFEHAQQGVADKQLRLNILLPANDATAEAKHLLDCLGQLWLAGVKIDWSALNNHERFRISLPTYPFERQRFWDVMSRTAPLAAYQRKMQQNNRAKTSLYRTASALSEVIADVVKTHFGFTTINIQSNFFDLGASSLDISQLGSLLSTTLGQEIQVVTLYTYPSVQALADYLFAPDEKISQLSSDSAALPLLPTTLNADALENKIAVIGMSGRFPGASDIQMFWHNIINAVESISTFSVEELVAAGVPKELAEHPNYIRAKGVIEDVEYFDANFFDYAPKEAEIMDPQFRMLHECAWNALEDAGYDPQTYKGLIGVYSGTTPNLDWLSRLGEKLMGAEHFSTMLLNDREFFSTALSYKLNLRGPSITMQTACSTALVNIVLACQALLSNGCNLALAGGVTVTSPLKAGYLYQEGMINSPDGHCRSFDEQAGGTVFGDGAGIVALKRLNEAVADGDHIYAVICGFAINNDGNQKVGYTAPSTKGQAAVIRAAMSMAEVEPESISYIEAHGTGTTMGDPIEIEALKAAFQTQQRGYCQIGSVKSNVGHLNAASGAAGLIKTVLALQHRQIPPSLHFERANPRIDFAASPFVVSTQLTPWHNEHYPLRAGVSSFGIGGTNAHVILEEAPAVPVSRSLRDWHVLPLAAKSEAALVQMAQRLSLVLHDEPDVSLADVAYTLQVGRAHFGHRRMVIAHSVEQAIAQLSQKAVEPGNRGVVPQESRPLFWLFPGQGAQYVNMGQHLYARDAVFRAAIERCLDLAQTYGAGDLRALLYPIAVDAESEQRLQETQVAQPVLFSVEYALAQVLLQWGIKPQGMLGHSIGEYVAGCLAGVFSLEDAMRLVVRRGQLMSQAPTGAMLSVELSEAHVQSYLREGLSLAAVNTPQMCVVAGRVELIEVLEAEMQRDGHRCRRVPTSHAFHSALMEPVLEAFGEEVKRVALHAPQIPYLSNVSGTWIHAEEATDPAYWVRHLRTQVRFAEGISHLLEERTAILVEVGPGNSLSTFARQGQGASKEQLVLNLLRHRREEQPDDVYLLNRLGRLWIAGVNLNWTAAYAEEQRRRLSLPTYPFERQRFWLEENAFRKSLPLTEKNKKKEAISEWFHLPSWQRSMMPVVNDVQLQAYWLIFQDKLGLSSQIVELLMDKGINVIRVDTGSQYTRLSAEHYIINPDLASDYLQLLKTLSDTGKKPETIIHMWNILPIDAQNFKEVQTLGYYSMIYLAQAISLQKHYELITISVITNGMVEVTGGETLFPEQATILGPCKVIPQEYSNIRCKNIDVDFINGQNTELVARRIVEENISSSVDPMVAYRGNHRWIQEFSSVHLEAGNTTLFNDGGVYLIIGGLGEIGLVMANYLAKHHRAKLILVGKSWFPPRDEWIAWAEKKSSDGTIGRRIHAIRQLEEYGSEVVVARADISREEDMLHVINDAEHRYGRINGVIHSAGLPGGDTFRAIQQINHEIDEEQFVAKVYGVQVLEKVLRGKSIDFCLLFSSIASTLGGLGFCAYTAANQYLDTFVQKHNQQNGAPWLCINWDAWDFSGGADIPSSLGGSIVAAAIVPDQEGEEVLQRISASGFRNQLLVSTFDLQERLQTWIYLAGKRSSEENHSTASFARPALSNPYIEPVNEMEKKLVELWKIFFRIEQVGIHDNFFELGASSLDAIQITHRIKETLALNIPIVTIFTYPTIALLSNYLTDNADPIVEEIIKPEERIEGRQKIQMRRLRRMQEDE